ncbi:hypothetical protein [Mucilaginibacter sp. L3T2-6]|uniref:hypothetical protein n=1 Tax=Mucilaginibacter sp. L3T2-6 TaxID=3062491 RepID=UPI0026773C40|nr:hypothetical protein [Mucilaginibacter sp. L3T2-6]MDO3645244.1 hypothetical protein [Mucilaginibacter sp. L3T2-6]MDV6217696.1 hypothetical protein [Mucilaginibacter sp. L3T2-6]
MKKLFGKEDHTALWIGAAVAGALAAAAGIWFYLRGKRAAEAEAYRHEHAQDYLKGKQKKKKKHKTAVDELEDIVHHPQA